MLREQEKTITIRFVSIWTLVSILTSVQSNLKAIQEVVNCYGEKYVAKYRYDSFKSKKPRPSLKKDNYLKESLGQEKSWQMAEIFEIKKQQSSRFTPIKSERNINDNQEDD